MAATVLRGVLCVAFESSAELLVSVGNESGHLKENPFLILSWDPTNLGQGGFLLHSREPRNHFNSPPSPS